MPQHSIWGGQGWRIVGGSWRGVLVSRDASSEVKNNAHTAFSLLGEDVHRERKDAGSQGTVFDGAVDRIGYGQVR